MRVASAHSTRSSQKSPLLSIDDVYTLAERTRMRTSLEARHLVLAHAQTQTILVQRTSALSRPDTGSVVTAPGLNATDPLLSPRLNKSDTDKSTSPLGQVTDKGEGIREEDLEKEESTAPPLGFVRNVQISFKPRIPPISSSFNHDSKYRLTFHRSQTMPAGFATSTPRGIITPPQGEGRESRDTPCQCVDVTAPSVCRECRKSRAISVASERMQTTFPPLNLSEKHVTSSALVRRARPDLTPGEIQDKISTGEIANSPLIFPRHHSRDKDNTDEEEDDESENTDERSTNHQENESDEDFQGRNSVDSQRGKQTPPSPTKTGSPINSMALVGRLKLQFRSGEATTPLYFMDLKHMNSKIFHGRTVRSRGGKKKKERADSKPLWPVFVSPRRVKLIEEPTYRAYFDPPLLAKRKQIPNPAFFAGSDDPYSLPERLPDILEFAGGSMAITDPNTLVSDSSSLSSSSRPAKSLSKPDAVAAKSAADPVASTSSDVAVSSAPSSVIPVTSVSSVVPATSTLSSVVPVTAASTAVHKTSSSGVVPQTSASTVTRVTSESDAVSSASRTEPVTPASTVSVTPAASDMATVTSESTLEPGRSEASATPQEF